MAHASLASAAALLASIAAAPAFAVEVPFSVASREPAARAGAVVTSGVPFARGALRDPSLVRVVSSGAELPAQVRRTASWSDGSVRWLLVDLQADLPASPGVAYATLVTGSAPKPVAGVTLDDGPAVLTARTGAASISFDKRELSVHGLRFEVVSGGRTFRAVPEAWGVEEPGPVKGVVRVEGRFAAESGRLGGDLVGFLARLTFHRNDATVRAALTFRNRGAFCWDAEGCTPSPGIVLTAAAFGVPLLPSGGTYVLGPGAEKTWDVRVSAGSAPRLVDPRYAAGGTLAAGAEPPPPLAALPPAYVASTEAWGRIALPVRGLDVERQQDFDRFEKLQRAKVIAAEVEDPPGLRGTTAFEHLAADLGSWNDYGDLRWAGNGCGSLSGNHYDWSFGMALHWLRTGLLPFADAARLFARHEIDLDIYHTGADGPAFNFQKNWEDRPSHDSPDNCFGGGRPTHTWSQGYALHGLLTGDPRGLDAFREIQEGVRQYVYEAFSGEGHVSTSEIRTQGWLVENLVARWRIEPDAVLATSSWGPKTIPQAIWEVLEDVFEREAAAGGRGFVFDAPGEAPDPDLRAPLQHLYFLEPAIEAYSEVFAGRDPERAARLLGLIRRMTDWIVSVTYGGDSGESGSYRPLQVPYAFDARQPPDGQGQGQVLYALLAANAAAFLALETGEAGYRDFARAAFRDAVRYAFAIPGDTYGDPALRSPASYASSIFVGTESKVHGWTSRYGQWVLAAEATTTLFVPVVLALHGRNGSDFTTELTLTNRGSRDAVVRCSYTAFSGGGSGSTTRPLLLPAGRQVVLPNALSFLREHGVPVPAEGERGGTLHVAFEGPLSRHDVSVTARTTTPAPPAPARGRAGLAYAGLGEEELLSAPVLLCGLTQTAADRSAVAVQNAGGPGAGDVTLRVTCFAGGGAPAATLDVTLPPGGFAQPALPSAVGAARSLWARVERVAGSAPWYAYGVVNDNGTNDGSFVPPVSERAPERLVLPVAVEAAGFTTELVVTNVSGSPQTVSLSFAPAGSGAGLARTAFDLAPRTARVFPSFVDDLRRLGAGVGAAGPAFAGPVLADAPGPLVLTARTTIADPGGSGRYGLAYSALPASALAAAPVLLDSLRQGDGTRTNLAIVNAGGEDAGFRVEVFDGATGLIAGTREERLPPLGFVQVGRVLDAVAPGVVQGWARVSPLRRGTPFLAYAVLNDGESPGERTGDGAFVAMVPEGDAPAP